MNSILIRYFSVFAGLLLLVGCEAKSAQVVTPKGDVIAVEVAATMDEKMKGLMGRTSMPENAGMLFVFEKPQLVGFWMKDTLIPLDVLYLDPNGKILDIQTMTPCPPEEAQCPSYPTKEPMQYALEINGGRAQELGLVVGDSLKIQGMEGMKGMEGS